MTDAYYSDQDFASWLASLPGETEAQKLNYLQDILGTVGVDLFGSKQEPYIAAPEPINQVEAVWGKDPAMSAIMDFIQFDGMSPKAAVDEARKQNLIPKYNASVKGEVNYLDLASQFASEEAKRVDWQRQQDVEKAKYEAGRKPGLNDLFQTPYEQMGAPSVDDLMADYASKYGSRYSASSLGLSPTERKQIYAPHVPGSPETSNTASSERITPANLYPNAAPDTPAPTAPSPAPVPVSASKLTGAKGKAARDAQQAKAAERFNANLRKNLEQRIALNQRGRVSTPKGDEVMRNLAMLDLIGD